MCCDNAFSIIFTKSVSFTDPTVKLFLTSSKLDRENRCSHSFALCPYFPLEGLNDFTFVIVDLGKI